MTDGGRATPTAHSGSSASNPPDEFPIAWPDPEDENITWELDDMHMPFALTPLSIDYVLTLGSGFNHAYERFGAPLRVRMLVLNGYGYTGATFGVPAAEVPAMIDRLRQAYRDFAPDNLRYWLEEAVPELKSIYARIVDIAA
jgi:hypothetical protein